MNYERMTWQKFGAELLRTQDLDPAYSALACAINNGLDRKTLARLLLAYWCLYHLGAAARLAEERTEARFWDGLERAARNDDPALRWPRGSERRHWRGEQSIRSAASLRAVAKSNALGLIERWAAAGTFQAVSEHTQGVVGFGPWITFKVADMLERVWQAPISFENCSLGVYKDPRQGAALIGLGDWQAPVTDDQLQRVLTKVQLHFGRVAAPPWCDRTVNVQEAETILCKYKSHFKGSYPLFKDTLEIEHGLAVGEWGDIAKELRHCVPKISEADRKRYLSATHGTLLVAA